MFSERQKKGVFIVTGASSGIGYAVVLQLLAQDVNVIGIARRPSNIKHKNFLQVNGDLTNNEFVEEVYDKLKSTSTISALIFCHGSGKFAALEQFSNDAIEELMAVNFTSIAFLLRRFVPKLKTQGFGDIIAIGSEAALKGAKQGSIYCASKFALRGLMQALRAECATNGVRVGLINPGMVNTPFFNALHFMPGESENAHLLARDVADCVLATLSLPTNAVIDEINLSPLVTVVQKKNDFFKR